ncbi:MAG: ATP-binding protein [Acidobacteria bacterium]|nr:ATP-binding protein [Acidobacteriota bacterium]
MTPYEDRSRPADAPSTDSTDSCEANSGQALRQRAEALASEQAGGMPESREALPPDVAWRAFHELRVHQIELEMQNEELRRTQEELEVSRARYFDLYDLAPVGYFTLSEQGLILEANLTAARLLGVARSALVKCHLSRFILAEDQDIHYRHRKALLETGAPQAWDMRVLKKDGAPIWVRVEATTADDADGVSRWRAVVSDITERKLAERALKATNAELQEFAYAITHNLQEPLRMVVNFSQLLARDYLGKLGESADQYITYSVEGALRIQVLLKGLLNYWEVAGRDVDRLSPVDCNHVLSQALLSLQAAIQQSGATVTSDPLPAAVANEGMLSQLFLNLLSNAIKYRGAAAPKIHVSAARTAEGWLFSVSDNGIGIDPAYAEHVFGMFKRLHGGEIPGTGIGLALCRKVVERHGGRIWVESEAGRGATFKFTFPTEGPS